MRNLRLLICTLIMVLSFGRMTALVRYDIQNLTSREITEIIQDKKGFIWIGTDNGLNRFDGWSNVTFTHNREDSTSLKSNMVEALFNDIEGNLWVGTGGGLQRYEVGTEKFRNVTFPDIAALSVRSIIQRNKNELLVVTSGYGAFSVDTRTMKATRMDSLNNIIGTPYAHIVRLDPLNRIWIGSAGNQLIILDRNLNKLHSSVFSDKILDIVCDTKNNVYVATDYQIYRWDSGRKEFETLKGESGWRITGMQTISDGTILLHTLESGVFHISSDSIIPEESYSTLKGEGILIMYEDRDGDIWVGTRKGGLAMQSSAPEMFRFQKIATPPSVKVETIFNRALGPGVAVVLSDGRILPFDPDLRPEPIIQSEGMATSTTRLHDGTILLGYADGKIMKYTGKSATLLAQPSAKRISVLAEDNAGHLYASIEGEGFMYQNGKGDWISIAEATPMATSARLGNDWVTSIIPDQRGKVWLGHYNGIDLFDPEAKEFTESRSIQSLRAHIVYTLLKAKDNTVWIGTNNGLYHLFPEEDRMDFYGEKEGLTGNIIAGIQQANNGDIWVTTNNGISRVRYTDNKVINYLTGNGLGERNYRKGMLIRGAGDKLFAVGYDGITAFYPDAITDAFPIAAPTLTRINLNNKDKAFSGITYEAVEGNISAHLRLRYNQNTFSLEFSNFDYRNPGSVSFEYRIPKLDKEWRSNPFGDNRAICNYLEPGNYILEVRALENGIISPTTSILIEILPPWYLTIWAKIVYFILIALACTAIWYVMRRHRQQKKNEEIAEEKFKMLYNFAHELRSPVTLITSPLTSLIQEEKDEKKANTFRMIQRNGYRITNLVNQMLDARRIEKGQLKLSFSETDLKEYLELIIEDFRIQAESRRISLTFSAPDVPVEAYIDRANFDKVIVNLISNALKFTPDGGKIDVTLKKRKADSGIEMAIIEVADSGGGIPPHELTHIFDRFYQADRKSKGFGIGLNLSKMLVEMHHGNIRAINRSEGTGAVFEVSIPMGRSHLKDKEINSDSNRSDNEPKRYIEVEETMPTPNDIDDLKGNRQYRILIVDDDEEIRQYLKRELGTA